MTTINYNAKWLTSPRDHADWMYAQDTYLVKGTIRKEHGLIRLSLYAVKKNGRLEWLARQTDYADTLIDETREAQYPRLQMLLDLLRCAHPQHNYTSQTKGLT